MNDNQSAASLNWTRQAPSDLLEENRPVVEGIERMVKERQREDLVALMKRWNPVDVVQLLIHLRLKRARKLFQWLPSDPAAKIVAELKPDYRAALMEEATLARYAELLNAQDPETVAKHLDAVPDEMVAAVLPRLKAVEEIRSHRAYREDSAGSVMTRRFVAVPADWSVDQAIAEIRRRADVVKKLYAVYVVDDDQRLQGFVKLPNLLVLPKDARIGDHMKTE